MDVDGRVLRFDSFSKLLCSGIRLGWATGPAELIERLQLHTQASNLHTCGVSQARGLATTSAGSRRDLGRDFGVERKTDCHFRGDLAQALVGALFDTWAGQHGGDALAGFEGRMRHVADFYRGQRDAFIASAERHLTGLAKWTVRRALGPIKARVTAAAFYPIRAFSQVPEAGMFVWLDLLGVGDSHALIAEGAVDAKARALAPPTPTPHTHCRHECTHRPASSRRADVRMAGAPDSRHELHAVRVALESRARHRAIAQSRHSLDDNASPTRTRHHPRVTGARRVLNRYAGAD